MIIQQREEPQRLNRQFCLVEFVSTKPRVNGIGGHAPGKPCTLMASPRDLTLFWDVWGRAFSEVRRGE
jgi:hypothetical protein